MLSVVVRIDELVYALETETKNREGLRVASLHVRNRMEGMVRVRETLVKSAQNFVLRGPFYSIRSSQLIQPILTAMKYITDRNQQTDESRGEAEQTNN